MLALKVEKRTAEAAKNFLRQKGVLSRSAGASHDERHVFFPVEKKVPLPFGGTWVKKTFEKVERVRPFETLLKGKLNPVQRAHLVASYDVVGDIAILEIPKEIEKKEKLIAKTVLEANPLVRTVLKKASAMEGKFRVRQLKFLAGKKNFVATYKENGVTLVFDLRKTYFSTRLSFERGRIASLVRPDEKVLALFAGVGPFALVIAKRQPSSHVVAVELNPYAAKAMQENVFLNRLSNVTAIQGDVREVLEKYPAWADRVTMPLPHTGEHFLDSVLYATKNGGVIHFYTFGGQKEGYFRKALRLIRNACREKGLSFEILQKRIVRPYAPYVNQVVVDFRVSRK